MDCSQGSRARAGLASILFGSLVWVGMTVQCVDDSFAHGGRYPGGWRPAGPGAPPVPQAEGGRPSGQKTPSGRAPGGTPAPAPGGGNTGGVTVGGGQTPGVGGGVSGGGSVGPRVPATRGVSGARRRTAIVGEDRWEVWWANNRDPLLRVREHLSPAGRRVVTGSADWLLGTKPRVISPDAAGSQDLRVVPADLVGRTILPVLRGALEDEDFDVRAAAVVALGKSREPSSLPLLQAALSDKHPQVVESAALGLGLLGRREAIPVLCHLLDDDSEGRRAVRRPAGVPYRTRGFAALALGLVDDVSVIPALLDAADPSRGEAHRDIAVCAVEAIGLLGSKASSAVATLEDHGRKPSVNEYVRSQAVLALGKIGVSSSVPLLRRCLRDRSLPVRVSATIALGRIPIEPGDLAPTASHLRHVVRKGSDLLQRNLACISLGRIGGPLAIKTLKQVVAHESGSLRAFGALGLALHARAKTDSSVVAMLRSGMSKARENSLRSALTIALGIVSDGASGEAIEQMVFGRGDDSLRAYGAVALGMLQRRDAAPALRKLLEGDAKRDPDFVRAIATSLGLLGDAEAVPILVRTLEEGTTEYVKSAAAVALGQIGDRRSVAPLARVALDTKRATDLTRAQAIVALGMIAESGSLPELSRLRADSNYRHAVEVIMEILTIS